MKQDIGEEKESAGFVLSVDWIAIALASLVALVVVSGLVPPIPW